MVLTHRSQVALYVTVFLSCISFSIVMPTLWPYLYTLGGAPFDLAAVVASYSVGEALGALLFAHVAKHLPTRRAMVLCQLCGVVGSLLYVYPFKLAVLTGRIMHGLWTGGSQAVQQSYLADILPHADLTPAIVAVNAYATLGFVFGPAIGFLISLAVPKGLTIERYMMSPLAVPANIVAPGFAVLASAVACTALYAAVFDEDTDRAHAASSSQLCGAADSECNNITAVYGAGDSDRICGEGGATGNGGEYVVIQSEALTKEIAVEQKNREIRRVSDGEAAPLLTGTEVDKTQVEGGQTQTSGEARPDGYSMQILVFCNVVFFVHFYGFALQETVMT